MCNFLFFMNFQGVLLFIIFIIQFTAKSFTEFIPGYKPSQIKSQLNNNIQIIPQINLPINNFQNRSHSVILEKKTPFYELQINELNRLLNEEKNKNIILINENTNLKNTINNLKKESLKIKQYEERIKSLENEIIKKNLEIQNFQSPLKDSVKTGFSIKTIKTNEKIMAINFVSIGNQDIGHYALECKNTDLFVRLEERLYNDFPDFKNYETYFTVDTRRIKRFKTLEENKIKNHAIINIFKIEE